MSRLPICGVSVLVRMRRKGERTLSIPGPIESRRDGLRRHGALLAQAARIEAIDQKDHVTAIAEQVHPDAIAAHDSAGSG